MPMRLTFLVLRFVLIGGLVLLVVSWLYNSLVFDRSYKGYVNGKVVHIRPPMKGQLKLASSFSVGSPIKAQQVIGHVENERAFELLTIEQTLAQRIAAGEQTLASLNAQLANRQSWLGKLGSESAQAKRLRVSYESTELQAKQAELAQAELASKQAKTNADRYARLAAQGFVPKIKAEEMALAANDAANLAKTAKAQLASEQARLKAATQGGQVDGSLTRDYSDVRRYDVETDLQRLLAQRSQLQAEIDSLKLQQQGLSGPLKQQKQGDLVSPVNGVVWNVGAYDNEYVTDDSVVLEVLNCDSLWVDAYVNEQQLADIDASQPVKLNLLSRPELGTLEGRITLVRSGVGKVTVTEGVAALDEMQKSQALLRLSVAWPNQTPDLNQSCNVGTSVKAKFAKKPFNWSNFTQLAMGVLPF